MSYEKVMKELPNILDLRESFFLSVDGKLSETDVKNISIELHERPGGRVLYKGSLLGIMSMPRNQFESPCHQMNMKFMGNLWISMEEKLSLL